MPWLDRVENNQRVNTVDCLLLFFLLFHPWSAVKHKAKPSIRSIWVFFFLPCASVLPVTLLGDVPLNNTSARSGIEPK